MDKPFRGPELNEAVQLYVKQYIIEHNLNGGDPLPPENQLAEDLGIGRGSVREAIKALQSLGIVEVRRGHGLFVREYNLDAILENFTFGMRFDPNTLLDLLEARILLERAAIEDTILRIGQEELEQLEEVMASWKKCVRAGKSYKELDEEFHRILYSPLKNQTLMKLFEVFWIAFENLDVDIIQQSNPEEEFETHQAILNAAKARDTELARQLLVEHFSHLQNRANLALQMDGRDNHRS